MRNLGRMKLKATELRSLGVHVNYLAVNRVDIQYPVKELCLEISLPSVGGWRKLKRLTIYLKAIGIEDKCW